MVAGREMDALIAEKVMGWRRCPDPAHGAECSFWFDGDGNGHTQPEFSTYIADAWQVVEKVGVDGMALINDDNGKWAVVWDGMQPAEHEEGQPFWTSYIIEPSTPWADTVPLAICLAALKASGVEVA